MAVNGHVSIGASLTQCSVNVKWLSLATFYPKHKEDCCSHLFTTSPSNTHGDCGAEYDFRPQATQVHVPLLPLTNYVPLWDFLTSLCLGFFLCKIGAKNSFFNHILFLGLNERMLIITILILSRALINTFLAFE